MRPFHCETTAMAMLKCLVVLACVACSTAQSISLIPSAPRVVIPDNKYNSLRITSCKIPCAVQLISDDVTVAELSSLWEKSSQGTFVHLREIPRVNYPPVQCQENSRRQVACDLVLTFCIPEFRGSYRCTITNHLDGSSVSHTTLLEAPSLVDRGPTCFQPTVRSFSAHMNMSMEPPTLEVNWELTERTGNTPFCRGVRDWRVRYYNFSHPNSANDHIAPEPSSNLPLSDWFGRRRVNSYTFVPGEITRDRYYLFQLQIQKVIEDEDSNEHDGIFTSLIYYFGEQSEPQFITPQQDILRVIQGHDITLSCDAVGIPQPAVRLLKDISVSPSLSADSTQIASRTIIKANREDDAGTYFCYAKNTQVGPPFGKRTIAAVHEFKLFVDNPIIEDGGSSITCRSYDKSTCSSYITSLDIFLNYTALTNTTDYNLAEVTLHNKTSTAFEVIESYLQDDSSSEIVLQCRAFMEAIICHTFFPYCASTPDAPIAQSICNHTCKVLTSGPCGGLLDLSNPEAVELQELLLSRCDDRVKPAGDSIECFAMPFPLAEQGQHYLEYAWCLEGEGENYNGDKTRTISGVQCQSWNSQTPHRHPLTALLYPVLEDAGRSCRNPGGLGTRPWCYTSSEENPLRWEYCDIPICDVCVPYEGRFCSGFEGYNSGEEVYLDRKIWEEEDPDVETWMVERFESLGGVELYPGCAIALKQLICFTALPLCRNTAQASPRELCGQHCALLADARSCPAEFVGEQRLAGIWKVLPAPECGSGAESRQSNCLPSPVRITLPENFTPTESYYNSTDYGQSYRGLTARSGSGILCQRWDTTSPHAHSFSPQAFPDLENAENFCRNPGQFRRKPWCFTTNRSIEWQYCNVPSENEITDVLLTTGPPVPNSNSAGQVAAIVTVGLGCFASIVIGTCILVYCISKAKKPKRYQAHNPLSLGQHRTVEEFHGNSAELKLHYNQQYSAHTAVLANYESVIATFTQFDKEKVKYVKQLGQGNFGVVFQGQATGLIEGEEESIVAVKTLKEERREAVEDFIHEAKLMFSFDHQNVLKIYAVCMKDPPFYMLTEFMDKGDLSKFLRDCASSSQRRYLNPSIHRSRTESNISNDPAALTATQLTDICKQIAAGMEYLSKKNHVHRDLACRNCLVKSEGESESGLLIKIGDFGMSHNLYSQNYFRVKGHAVLPIRWMAPESVIYGKFSTAGDVYSFGVVMWEVFSFAMQPYFGKTNDEVADAIRKGHILSCPVDCPQQIYDTMIQCWKEETKDRPHFSELHNILNECRSSVSSSSGELAHSRESLMSDDAFYDNVCGQSLNDVTV